VADSSTRCGKSMIVLWYLSMTSAFATNLCFWTIYEMGVDYMGLIKPPTRYTRNQYIIVAIDYMTKWVEAKVLWDNTARSTVKFLYENIITWFSFPTHLVSDQGSYFINSSIKLLVQEFMITHHKSTTYYFQGNGQT
jgi:hypothetical protein